MKYTLNLDNNNYVLSIAHTPNDNIELDLSECDLRYLNAYQFSDGKLVLDDAKKQAIIETENAREETPTQSSPTLENRVGTLESTTDDIILMIAELIGG